MQLSDFALIFAQFKLFFILDIDKNKSDTILLIEYERVEKGYRNDTDANK